MPCSFMNLFYSRFTPPPSHPFVKATLEGLQCSLAKPVTKKEPITLDMLEAMVKDAEKSGSLSDLRLATACSLGFAVFLCFDELIHLRSCDFVSRKRDGDYTYCLQQNGSAATG